MSVSDDGIVESALRQRSGVGNLLTTSYNCVYHESEKISYLSSGRDLYGESLPASITITPTGRVAGSEMTVQTYVAAAATSEGTSLTATLGNTEVPFDATAAALAAPAGYDNFRLIQPYASVTPDADNGSYTLTVGVANTAALSKGALDYAMVTYTQENSLGSRSQMNINYSFSSSAYFPSPLALSILSQP